MIFDDIGNLARYRGLNEYFDKVIDYLATHDVASYDLGEYEIDGEHAFLFVQENQLNQSPKADYEFHERYADIHFLLAGRERVAYGHPIEEVVQAYDKEQDIGFVTCKQDYPLFLEGGTFALFLPQEAHQPNIYAGATEQVKKCLVKVLW